MNSEGDGIEPTNLDTLDGDELIRFGLSMPASLVQQLDLWRKDQGYANSDQGWIKYDRHTGGSNYIYYDGHVKFLRWRKARLDQFPDHVVRFPLINPPQ